MLFARAERAWRRLPNPYEEARARTRRGRNLLVHGDQAGASVLLGALADFEALGASGDGAGVRAILRHHGVPLPYPWRGGRRSYGDQLSPREAQVARLASAGRTNREIADALFLSPRTVEGHLSSARRKLGAGSRKELATLAPQVRAKNG